MLKYKTKRDRKFRQDYVDMTGEDEDYCFVRIEKRHYDNIRRIVDEDKEECSIKGSWTKQEDNLLLDLVEQYGPRRWAKIAKNIRGRAGKQCRERYLNHLDPHLNQGEWSRQEDDVIMNLHRTYGNQWAKIARYLKGRTPNKVKNRWNSSLSKREDEMEEMEESLSKVTPLPNIHRNMDYPHPHLQITNANQMCTPGSQPFNRSSSGISKGSPYLKSNPLQFTSCPQQVLYDQNKKVFSISEINGDEFYDDDDDDSKDDIEEDEDYVDEEEDEEDEDENMAD